MTSHYTHYRTSFLCIDKDAEASGSASNENGALLYLTQPSSTLTPPAYSVNYELACAHCTSTSASRGSVFVEWGTTTCPSNSFLIYTGSAMGAYSSYAGGYETLCPAPVPDYLLYNAASAGGAYVYQAHYQTSTGGVTSFKPLNNGGVPCSMCQRPNTRPYGLVVPGSTQCPLGYALDYSGFLMSPAASGQRGQYSCFAEGSVTTGSRSSSGALLYEVQGMSPLPPNYFSRYELPCATCSGMYIAS